MSLNGSGPILSRAAQDRISALSSANQRLMREKNELTERVTVLTGIAQAHADDRDSYMEQAAGTEKERDTARAIAIELEQQLAQVHSHLREIYRREMADPENGAIVARECLDRFDDVTQTVLNDMVADQERRSA